MACNSSELGLLNCYDGTCFEDSQVVHSAAMFGSTRPLEFSPLCAAVAMTVCIAMLTVSAARAQEPTPVPVVPVARIISPIQDQELRGAVSIQGAAVAPTFLRYEIAYAVAAPEPAWITLGGSTDPVPNGRLATWNTRPLPDGEYLLRLQVYTADENFFAVVTGLRLTNAAAAAVTATGAASTTDAPRTNAPNEFDTARDALSAITDAAERIPAAFLRGARLAAIALGALIGYGLLKSLVLAALRRATRRPIDYGA